MSKKETSSTFIYMKTTTQKYSLLIGFLFLFSNPIFSQSDLEYFEMHIRPALVEHCYKCHSNESKKSKGGLLVDSKQALLIGGDSGPAIVPGNVEGSLLIEAIRYTNPDLQMPEKKKWPKDLVAKFETWVENGAYDPRNEKTKQVSKNKMNDGRRDYWAFQEMQKTTIPTFKKNTWGSTPIDAYIYEKLKEKNLQPNSKANPETLLRRLSLDLIGLIPSDQQIRSFKNNPSKNQYEKIVDKLLASEQFGIKWSRFWLDLARYTETAGGGRSYPVPVAWRYRNYVIDSFNHDVSYYQFIKEQIAGDLLEYSDNEERIKNLVATGFMVIGPKPLDQANKEVLQYDHIDEQLHTIGKSMMGMTIGCARCHDHRFDPVTEKDYYRMASIFSNTKGLQQKLISRFNDVPLPGAPKNIIKQASQETNQYRSLLKKISHEEVYLQTKGLLTSKRKEELLHEYEALIQKDSLSLKALALNDKEEMLQDYIRIRGQVSRKGAAIIRSAPLELIPNLQPEKVNANESGRIQLANWITHPKNPLTHRVIVNRIWAQLMSKGIVESLDNFGVTGTSPSHSELLDHLALNFIKSNGSFKKLIKSIVMSSVYQMSTELDNDKKLTINKIDPNNHLLSYYPKRRMSAEMLRDTIMQISGHLNKDIVSGVVPYANLQNSSYRSVFLPTLREEGRNHLLDAFDFPDASASVGKRNVTNLPTQSLYLMNSPFMMEQTQKTVEKLQCDFPTEAPKVKLSHLHKRIFGKPISEAEKNSYNLFLNKLSYSEEAWTMLAHTMMCSLNFRYF